MDSKLFLVLVGIGMASGAASPWRGMMSMGGKRPPMMSKNRDYFMAAGPDDDCTQIPEAAEILHGCPMTDTCNNMEVGPGDKICVCIRTPPMMQKMRQVCTMIQVLMMKEDSDDTKMSIPAVNEYHPVCGTCKDPCQLRFRPEPMMKRMSPAAGAMGMLLKEMLGAFHDIMA